VTVGPVSLFVQADEDDALEQREEFDATIYESSEKRQELRFAVGNVGDKDWKEVALEISYDTDEDPIEAVTFDGTDVTGLQQPLLGCFLKCFFPLQFFPILTSST